MAGFAESEAAAGRGMTVAAAAVGTAALITWLARRPGWRRLFNPLPVPLWCYLIPAGLVSAGWLPAAPAEARGVVAIILPVALALILLGVDLAAIRSAGWHATAVAAIGAVGVAAGAAVMAAMMRSWLPAEGWKGAGALAGTWTGGSMNLTALQAVLDVPDAVFAPLLLVDALCAYTWMAVLLAAAPHQARLDRWLHATPLPVNGKPVAAGRRAHPAAALLTAGGVALASRWIAVRCPVGPIVPSAGAWTVLLVTTAALALSCWRPMRALGIAGQPLGSFALLIVLGGMGAQAQLSSLRATPVWLVFGAGVVCAHAAALLAAGRWLRVRFGVLATASQANIGGVISAPLVAAAYGRELVPTGLLLATAGNALGTYIGWAAAWLARALTG